MMPEKAFFDLLFNNPQLLNLKKLRPGMFKTIEARWVLATILNLFEKYKQVPTRQMVFQELMNNLTQDDPYEILFALVK